MWRDDSLRTGAQSVRMSHSCKSFRAVLAGTPQHNQCRSLPLVKPTLSRFQFSKLKQLIRKHSKQKFCCKPVKEESSCYAYKLLIRELAIELERVLKYKSRGVLRSVRKDSYSEKECQQFVLEWAPELSNLSHVHLTQVAGGEGSSRDAMGNVNPEEQTEGEDSRIQAKEEKLKEAQNILHQWTRTLKSKPKDSVCLGEDVCADVQDLERQWKRGKLSSTLPVIGIIMWAVTQKQSEGSAFQWWFRTNWKTKTSACCGCKTAHSNWVWSPAAQITLDPKTANLDLKMSRKRVKMDTIVESRDKHRDGSCGGSHKYNGWWCVLGTEGFTTGRHYWEVGVKGKRDWRIGVVKESAPRKGFVSLNTQCGYWTLRLQLGMLMALTVPVTKLPEVEIPSKVGVYLDIEEGQVSFYDAERRCHIYTFCDTFTEKVYPVFGTTETDKYLVIL
ncbi:E3 ubiquitin-protein ligase TRIM39-like [Arapaima gigas]